MELGSYMHFLLILFPSERITASPYVLFLDEIHPIFFLFICAFRPLLSLAWIVCHVVPYASQ